MPRTATPKSKSKPKPANSQAPTLPELDHMLKPISPDCATGSDPREGDDLAAADAFETLKEARAVARDARTDPRRCS